jgi:hypothetical protein
VPGRWRLRSRMPAPRSIPWTAAPPRPSPHSSARPRNASCIANRGQVNRTVDSTECGAARTGRRSGFCT